MFKVLIPLGASLMVLTELAACDACGCSAGGGGIGLLTAYRSNVVGLTWQYAPYRASELVNSGTRDYFHTFEFFFGYHPVSRLQVTGSLPYRWNQRLTPGRDANESVSGLSDARFLASYAVLDNALLGKNGSTLYWDAGLGVKAPTGAYDEDIYLRNLPDNFNTGAGSWSALLQTRMVYSRNNAGAVVNCNYQLNGASSSGYRFGDQLTTTVMAFGRRYFGPATQVSLFAGMFYEHIGKDDHPDGNNPHATGGQGYYAVAALNFQWDKWLIGANYAQPLHQQYSGGEVIARPRFSMNVAYVF